MSQELYDKSLEALRGDTPPEKRNIWKFGTREVVYSALGAALFAALSWVFNILLPMVGTGNVSFRVPIVVPMFFGIAFGPIVGFITGFLGNILGDLLSGYGFWFWWDLGNGIIGLVPGLLSAFTTDMMAGRSILIGELGVILGSFFGVGVASLSEMWVSGADWATVVGANFVPAFLADITSGLVLLPLLMLAYGAVVKSRGRN